MIPLSLNMRCSFVLYVANVERYSMTLGGLLSMMLRGLSLLVGSGGGGGAVHLAAGAHATYVYKCMHMHEMHTYPILTVAAPPGHADLRS